MTKLNSKRNYYFIKNLGMEFNENPYEFVEDETVKIIQSNFPDSIFLPLIASLYGNNIPELVLFIEGDDLIDSTENHLVEWFNYASKNIIKKNYDYIFGSSQIIDGKKIGCSLLLSKASIIQHLLYYTDSDTTHINPFIQLSLANKTKFCFIPFHYIKISNLENIKGKISENFNCPEINDSDNPSLCIMIPAFKRNYFPNSFQAFDNQTYKPKFYVIIQNDHRIYLNISLLKDMIKQPIYHIWMKNWNFFFFLSLRFSSVFPCDFILKYDDDQWPNDTTLQENLINRIQNKNIIIGGGGLTVGQTLCGYSPKSFKITEEDVVDHSAVPLLIRRGYLKLDGRNKIYRIFDAEDVHLSVNSHKLCNVTSKKMKSMENKLMQMQIDGNQHEEDKQFKEIRKKERKIDSFFNTYCYFIHSGYIPKEWNEFQLPKKDHINITIEHKRLF